ncbi:hypothetical protein CesoFtcFv8_024575 [Champsocephalus esox]|uniref:Uncharacterized protein n=1 Tax=Champsocephalus esox TaxID=159716 RepID=A0AAN8B624_9TELE|nr:hypothetical protein CesoFtcFv8_024575 [Champsocephalus esox]
MESVCAGEGFYQRQTLTGSPVWDCPSNSCVPQEVLHKKQLKNARRHFSSVRWTHREHRDSSRKEFYLKPTTDPSFKRTGSMEESKDPGRRLVPVAAAQPARANSPDDPRLRYDSWSRRGGKRTQSQ